MRYVALALVVLVSVLLSGCQTLQPRSLNSDIREDLEKNYINKDHYKAYAVALDNRGGYASGSSWGYSTPESAIKSAIKWCNESRAEYHLNAPCKIRYLGNKDIGNPSEADLKLAITEYKITTQAARTSTGSSSSTTKDFRWVQNIIGTYKGEIWSNGGNTIGVTRFYTDNYGSLAGSYNFGNENGSLDSCVKTKTANINQLTCQWNDEYGSGPLEISFSNNFAKFEGEWTANGDDGIYVWNGARSNASSENSIAAPEAIGEPTLASTGTGFFLSAKGQIITNAHAVEGCRFTQILYKNRLFP